MIDMSIIGALFAAASLYCTLPLAATFACDLPQGQKATVAEIRDGETLALADGTIVRLINAKTPVAPLAARGDRPWPFVAEAKQALTELASGAEIELRYGGAKADRHGRALAQVYVVKGGERLWLQGELVSKGLARVYSFPDNHACVDDLLAREAEARVKGAGLWGTWAYRVLDAGDVERLGRLTRSYQLVEGVVAQVGELGGRLYLNFDKDWRKDFTILMERKDGEAFKAAGDRSQGACRKEAQGAGLGRVAERPNDPRHPCRADRASARWRQSFTGIAPASGATADRGDRALAPEKLRPGKSRA